jgi:aryl-alcohol dehydrogenase-like predicted oxidoreductase
VIDGPVVGVQRLALLAPERAGEVLAHAVHSGIPWVDVADVYGRAPGDAERWLGSLRASLPQMRIATKGGLVRDGTRWRPDGRAVHLQEACEASCERLGLERIELYQLHTPDPRTPFLTQVRALRRLLDSGRVGAVGLCNVRVDELRRALDELPVATVQVEISPLRSHALRSGVVEAARERGLCVLGHRPLGGTEGIRRLLRDPVLEALARERELPVPRLVLAWLRELGVVPLPGPTREESVDELVASWQLTLDDEARAQLDRRFEPGRLLRRPRRLRAPPADAQGEVVIVMGRPGAGKTSRVLGCGAELRLNRDELGGNLEGLVPLMEEALERGVRHVVLDNTYASRASRSPVIEAAWAWGVPVRCEWLVTPEDDAEINLVARILDTVGRLPEPQEFAGLIRRHPGVIPPRALARYRQEFEPPSLDEGFARIDEIPFVRRPWPEGPGALVLDPRDLVPSLGRLLREQVEQGLVPVVLGWEPVQDEAALAEVLERVHQQGAALGLAVRAWSCPHPPGAPVCWCRKPLPGLLVQALRETGCDPGRSVVLGRQPVDRSLARKLGMRVLG